MAFIAAHVVFVTVVQTVFDRHIGKEVTKATLFDNFINGIANIYFHNQINQYDVVEEKSGRQQVKALDFGQQLFMESVILMENTAMLVTVIVTFQTNKLAIGLMIGSFCLYILGVVLKMVYYKFFYVWKDVLWTDLKQLKSAVVEMRKSKIGEAEAKTEHEIGLVEETQC